MVVVGRRRGARRDARASQRGSSSGRCGGVRCDAALRDLGAGRLCAAGDMCEWDSALHGGPARVEHWEVARRTGARPRRGMLGDGRRARRRSRTSGRTSPTGRRSEYVGVAAPAGWDHEVVRGSFDDGAFSVWYLRGEPLVGALRSAAATTSTQARRLIASGERVTPEALERS